MDDPTEKEAGNSGRAEDWVPEEAVAAYEQAIRDYEESYRHQQASSYGESYYDPYSYQSSQDYMGSQYAEQSADDLNQVLAEYEQDLQSLEQAHPEFGPSLRHMESLQGEEREKYIKEWKEYLQHSLEAGKQLVESIEKSMESLSEKGS